MRLKRPGLARSARAKTLHKAGNVNGWSEGSHLYLEQRQRRKQSAKVNSGSDLPQVTQAKPLADAKRAPINASDRIRLFLLLLRNTTAQSVTEPATTKKWLSISLRW